MDDVPDGAPSTATREEVLKLALAGRADEARSLCLERCRTDPGNAEAWFLCGAVAGQLGRLEEAIECALRAVALCPEHPGAHYNLGQAYVRQRQYEKAATSYREVLRLHPDDAEAHNALGHALECQGDYRGAAAQYRETLRIRPQHAEACNNLGNALAGLGRHGEAVALYRRAIQLAPRYAEAHNNLAATLQGLRRGAEAVHHYQEALRLRPDYLKARINLGHLLQRQRRYDDAAACFREVLRRDPDHAAARYLLAALEGTAAQRTPPEFVRDLFDGYADHFDRHLTGDLRYRVPQMLSDLVRRILTPAPGTLDILDLGCGTGLCGSLFRDLARTLTGVDLAPKMLEQARQKGVYDELVLADITQPLAGRERAHDLILAADVLIYLGDLAPLFTACRGTLRQGGVFALSIETLKEGHGYRLLPSGRFAHSKAYLRTAAHSAGMAQLASTAVILRKDAGQPVPGAIFLLRNEH